MRGRLLTYVPILVWIVALGLSCAYLTIAVAAGTTLGDAGSAMVGITFSTVGVIIASKRRQNRVGWIFLGIGVSLALNGFSFTFADYLRESRGGSLWHWFSWVGTWSWQPGFFLLFPTLFLVFPDGHVRWKRGRTFLKICGVALVASLLGTIWNPADLPGESGYRNPVGIDGLLNISDVFLVAGSLLWTPVALYASVRALHVRFRASVGVERQQLKWFVFAGLATLVLYVAGSSFYNMMGSALGGTVALIGVPLLPLATAVAILRYRLYDIDRILNRTLVYAALSIVLAAAYLLIVVLLQGAIGPLTQDSDLAIAGSTLAVAALFRPLRSQVQHFIDRRFYRRKYDAAETLEAFSTRLREQVDLESLRGDIVTIVRDTMQPSHASLWLRTGASE